MNARRALRRIFGRKVTVHYFTDEQGNTYENSASVRKAIHGGCKVSAVFSFDDKFQSEVYTSSELLWLRGRTYLTRHGHKYRF